MKTKIIKVLENRNDRSKWDKAVTEDAIDMLDNIIEAIEWKSAGEQKNLEQYTKQELLKLALNGARDWDQYCYGGCALVYDYDIALHYCTPSELKRTDSGRLRPNSKENWIEVQARALNQAFTRLYRVLLQIKKEG